MPHRDKTTARLKSEATIKPVVQYLCEFYIYNIYIYAWQNLLNLSLTYFSSSCSALS